MLFEIACGGCFGLSVLCVWLVGCLFVWSAAWLRACRREKQRCLPPNDFFNTAWKQHQQRPPQKVALCHPAQTNTTIHCRRCCPARKRPINRAGARARVLVRVHARLYKGRGGSCVLCQVNTGRRLWSSGACQLPPCRAVWSRFVTDGVVKQCHAQCRDAWWSSTACYSCSAFSCPTASRSILCVVWCWVTKGKNAHSTFACCCACVTSPPSSAAPQACLRAGSCTGPRASTR